MTPLPPALDDLHGRAADAGLAGPRTHRVAASIAAGVVVAGGLAATVAIIQARPARTPSGATAAPSMETASTATTSATTAVGPPLVDIADAQRLLPEIVIDGGRNEELARLDVDGNYSLHLVSHPDEPSRDLAFCIIEEISGQEGAGAKICGGDDNPRTDVGGLVEAVTNRAVSNDPSRGGPRVILLTAGTVTVTGDNCDPVTVKTAAVALSVCSPPPEARRTELTFTNTPDGTVVRIDVPITGVDDAPSSATPIAPATVVPTTQNESSGVPIVWRTGESGGVSDLAGISGVLRYDTDNGCFMLGEFPLVWPAGTEPNVGPFGVRLSSGVVIPVGSRIDGGGCYYQHVANQYGIPAACVPPTGEVAVLGGEPTLE